MHYIHTLMNLKQNKFVSYLYIIVQLFSIKFENSLERIFFHTNSRLMRSPQVMEVALVFTNLLET